LARTNTNDPYPENNENLAFVEAAIDKMTPKRSQRLRCNSHASRRVGPSKADASPAGITMRKILKIITKRLPSFYIDVPALRPGTIGAYAFAFVCVAAATALRLAVDPYVVGAQFVTFFPAVVITTLISGFGAGFFCAALSTAAADFFVLSPRWSFSVEDPANVGDLLLFGRWLFTA
jgi:hypothetical protein